MTMFFWWAFAKGKKGSAEGQKVLTARHCFIQKDDAGLVQDYPRMMQDDG
jgi:hypothetical protein